MSSSEREWGRRMARVYGPHVAQKTRAERIEVLRAKIAELETSIKEQNEAHLASCEKCRHAREIRGQNPFDDFCSYRLTLRPEEEKIRNLRIMISQEEADEAYAQEAREKGVDYKDHIDGFCSYWQNLRHRKFVAVDWKCERCNKETGALEAHHVHYNTVGFEELSDLRALCPSCHKALHRRASAV